MSKSAKPHAGMGQVRIIAGQWRSRRLPVADGPGLRPTPDRVRETLFNWLAPYVEGARVLDPFTGAGALTLEALSRGAKTACAMDLNGQAIANLKQNLTTLKCDWAEARLTDALAELAKPCSEPFDVVFLDPPFHQDLLAKSCALLEANGWLTDKAWVYTESEQAPSALALPANWRLHREKKAGVVYYALWQRQGL